MAGYCSLSPYGIIVVTERMNVRIIASSTHFALVFDVLFSGILAELFGQYKLHPHLEKKYGSFDCRESRNFETLVGLP